MKKMLIMATMVAVSLFAMPLMAQTNYQEVEVNDPCPYEKFPSTKELLRGHGVAIDRNQQFSVEKARAHAIADLASQIATTVDAIMEMTDESWDMNNTSNYAGHALQEIKTSISQTLGYNVACRKTMSYVQDGVRMMKTTIVVELGTDKASKTAFEVLSNNPEVNFEQSYEDFSKLFEAQFQ